MNFLMNSLNIYLVIVKNVKLKGLIVNVVVMKNYFYMIIKMCSIVLYVIFAIIENAEVF
jgi:hypothetical protein